MIFVDTGAWYAIAVETDKHHVEASAYSDSSITSFITTDFVVAETLTLLKSRKQYPIAFEMGPAFFHDQLAEMVPITRDDLEAAWQIFDRYRDKDWSFTDCTSFAIMERLGISTAFTIDHHFRQWGRVVVVPF